MTSSRREPSPRDRSTVRAGLAAVAALLIVLIAQAPAWAHATLIGTDPADGVLLETAPATITLTFTEPVTLDEGAVRILSTDGAELPSTAQAVDNRVVVTPQDLGTGTVIVTWRVVSADSHPIAGGFTFAVGERTEVIGDVAGTEQDLGVRIAVSVVQALAYLGILAACGLVAFEVLVLRGREESRHRPGRTGPDDARSRIRRLSGRCAVGGVVASFLLLPLTELRQQFGSLAGLLEPRTWSAQLGQDPGLTLVLAGAGVLLAWQAAWAVERRTAISAAAALAGCGLALGAFALVGHTRGRGPVVVVLGSDLLHLAVAAFWLGGVIGLGLVVREARADSGAAATSSRRRLDDAAAAVARFSGYAAVLVTLLLVTGILMAWRILGSWAALVGTGYGVTLLVKTALVLVAVAVAGYNRFAVLPGIRSAPSGETGWRRLRRSVTAEAGLLVAVVLVAGWLVNASPTLDVAARSVAGAEQTVPLGSGTLSARVSPGERGINSLEFSITGADGLPVRPLSDPEVTVTLTDAGIGPLTRPVSVTGEGSYQAVLDLPLPGVWTITISARVSEFEQPRARFPVTIP